MMSLRTDKDEKYTFNVDNVRKDFPIFKESMNGQPLVFLDTAASAQKPNQVIDSITEIYKTEYANVHRGLYKISETLTAKYEGVREIISDYINAEHTSEIIFTRNATESINLVARSFGKSFLKENDEIILSELEHHANIVPWQMLREEIGVIIKIAPINDEGEFIIDEFEKLLCNRTKLVAISHMSNVLGSILPVKEITRLSQAVGAKVLIDGCQAITHLPVDVQKIGCDFYVFSGHKLYGPSGVGVLYAREELLEMMPPFMGGGDMISAVTFEESTWAKIPHKFEAGTPAIVQVIGLGVAIEYLKSLGLEDIRKYEKTILDYATQKLLDIEGLRLIGTAEDKASVLSFTLDFAHPHDVATIIDGAGVAVRAGHHCAQPLMNRMNVAATVRASLGLYNTEEDIDRLVSSLHNVSEIFN
ncbi:MAG: Cysteine desulfurase [Alphaproteobacteria bacterium MarineAlpha12_Bin1]|jgi:cysteine desulfurase/selenocysteine lyase|nr:MAG: Cysteine desulfurase [Alphaproteobacteria bacterium MarineAlpha12_Bin1]|tara:strand:- start:478 stop:1731 length:1254 start_codon:yes stop_codon:yes gene_type:complete